MATRLCSAFMNASVVISSNVLMCTLLKQRQVNNSPYCFTSFLLSFLRWKSQNSQDRNMWKEETFQFFPLAHLRIVDLLWFFDISYILHLYKYVRIPHFHILISIFHLYAFNSGASSLIMYKIIRMLDEQGWHMRFLRKDCRMFYIIVYSWM